MPFFILLVRKKAQWRNVFAGLLWRIARITGRPLGLRPEFPLLRLLAWAQDHDDIDLIDYCEVAPLSAFTLVRFGRITLGRE